MEENLKVDKDYLEAFNLGYELAEELNLKSPMFQDLGFDNVRMKAMHAGMVEFSSEIAQEKNKNRGMDLSL